MVINGRCCSAVVSEGNLVQSWIPWTLNGILHHWHWQNKANNKPTIPVFATRTAANSYEIFSARLVAFTADSLSTPPSSSWSLHPLPSLHTQVERSVGGPECQSQSTYAPQISVFPFISPHNRGSRVALRPWGKTGRILSGSHTANSHVFEFNAVWGAFLLLEVQPVSVREISTSFYAISQINTMCFFMTIKSILQNSFKG